jgi:ABC-type phosphate transport system substrate-binding protein
MATLKLGDPVYGSPPTKSRLPTEAKRMTLARRRVFLALALILGVSAVPVLTPTMQAATGFKLIANPSVGVQALSRTALVKIFTKKSERWPDGSRVIPVDQPVGSAAREAFSESVHGKSSAVVDAFWQRQVFSGRALPPLTKAGDDEVLTYVRVTPGAIGYVSASASTSGVNLIQVK